MYQIIIFLLISQTYGFYQDSEVLDCSIHLNDEQLSEKIRIQPLDTYIFLIGGKYSFNLAPIAFFCTLFITTTFILYPITRKLPGDLVFFISLSDCILCIHWFLSALYQLLYQHGPPVQGNFCQINSYFSVFAGTGEFMYNVLFCVYLRISLKNILKLNKKLAITLHLIAWTAMLGVPIMAKLTNQTGLSLFGTCSFKQKEGFSMAAIVLVLIYMIISSYTIAYFKKAVPDDEKYLLEKQSFLQYYFRYIVASCVIWSSEAICYTIVGLNCMYFHEGFLMIFITLCNISKLCTPIVLSILRYHDPTIKRKVQKLFRKVSRVQVINTSSVDEDNNSGNYMDKIQQNLKVDQIVTLIYGVRLACKENDDDQNSLRIQRRKSSKISRVISIEIQDTKQLDDEYHLNQQDIDEEIIRQIDKDEITASVSIPTEIIRSTMTIYAQKAFRLLRNRDKDYVNIYESLNPENNKEQIKRFKGPDGGKGGEFMFFSKDNKLVIKTLKDEELKALRNRLIPYCVHLLKQESMICPIYGIFTFQRGQDKENILIMKNISYIDTIYTIRTYDMKGSENDREVLNKQSNGDLKYKTLKDIDFMKMEGRVFIDKDWQPIIRNTLIRDAQFFEKMKLMDYSLLIKKMDWDSYHKDTNQPKIKQSINFQQSVNENNIIYHMGIIDYLQEWNNEKYIEQKAKQALKGNLNLDTSAKPPDEYAQRFIERIANTII